MKKLLSILVIVLTITATSCKKPAGPGGDSTITGKVHVTNFSMVGGIYVENGQYMGADVDVYIIYGDDATYGDKIKTGPDGVFEFRYLRKGDYKVYVYTKDKDQIVAGNSFAPDKAVTVDASISGKKQTVDVGTLEIYK
jgi:hypothetical protein